MAQYIENQPVLFGNSPSCSCDEQHFKQIVDLTDTTQFQMKLIVCEGEPNLITNNVFETEDGWTLGENWDISDNALCVTSGLVEPAYYDYDFNNDGYYAVTITVDSISAGGSLIIKLGGTEIGTITMAGTYTFYGFPTDFLSESNLYIYPGTDDAEACISEVDAYEIAINNIVAIYMEGFGYINSISYSENPSYFDFSGNKLTVTINWNDLVGIEGCFYLCWMDACSNTGGQNYPPVVLNPTFIGEGDWIYGFGWTNDGGVPGTAIGEYTGLSDNCLVQENVFSSYSEQSISITIGALGGIGYGVDVYFGTTLVDTLTTAGTHTVTGTPADSLSISICPIAGTDEIHIINVHGLSVPPSDFVCDITSNLFKVGDYSNTCSMVVAIANTSNGFGFDYSTFFPQVRIEAKLRQSSYKGERLASKDSKGNRRVHYFDATKYMNLTTSQLPEYIHDFLRLSVGADLVLLDGVNYYAEDEEYTVLRDGSQDEFGYTVLLVAKNSQNIKNINCQSAENDGNSSGNLLLLEDGESISI